jgi:hypothetical protein
MAGLIETILLKNADLIRKKNQSINFEIDFEGKGLLNKEVSKLYDKNLNITEQQFEEVVVSSNVIIDKLSQLKNCSWDISELKKQLVSGVGNYMKNKESSNLKNTYSHKEKLLSSTAIGEHFDISNQRVNLILSELGWIEKKFDGWVLTKLGMVFNGKQAEHDKTGTKYVLWTSEILTNKHLLRVLNETTQEQKADFNLKKTTEEVIETITLPTALTYIDTFRQKFPATFRTKDGHMVRSRAELIIDNALYDYKLAHAYERKLPIEEDLYSDFFIPTENVYIEFWGMEDDPKYAERKKTKIAIYAKYDFKLIELTDQDIANLDDHLPKKLLKFGIKIY